jgi:TPR repeat protein
MSKFPFYFSRVVLATALVGSLAAAGPAFAGGKKAVVRDLSVEQAPIAEVGEGPDYPRSDIDVTAWTDHEDGHYNIGDTVALFVRASRDAYITVLDVGTSGKVHIIFPNRYQDDNRVPAMDTIRIPGEDSRFRIRVGGPTGREVIKVFATREPLTYFAAQRLVREGAYYTVPGESKSIARDLSVEIRERHHSDYGAATQVLEIRDGDDHHGDYNRRGDDRHGDDRRSDFNRHGDDHRGDYDRSRAEGSPEDLYKLGEAAFYGESNVSIRDALEYYTRAADAGHVQAMVRIGQIYEQGYDVDRDMVRALSWYRKAAGLGNTQAMVKLARLYGKGEGVESSLPEAVNWLTKAAEAGDGLAMANLAKAYDEGRGLSRNPIEAARFALNAVKAGAWSTQNDFPHFSEDTRMEIQKRLHDAGVYSGAIDGAIGPDSRSALAEYAHRG